MRNQGAVEDGVSAFAEKLSPDRSRKASEESLSEYASRISKGIWKGDGDFNYLGRLAGELQRAVEEGNGRVIVNMPGGMGKSELCSHYLPTYTLDRWPDRNVLLISYGDSLAKHYSRKVRDELRDNDRVETEVDPEKKGVSEFKTNQGGELRAVGMGGSLTGFHGDLIIVDDPIKNMAEAMSMAKRKNRRRWWEGTLWDRRKAGATVVMVMTRWDTDDLAAWVEQRPGDDWDVYEWPAIMTEDMTDANLLDNRDVGEVLNPTLKPKNEVESERKNVNQRIWRAKWQQNPMEDAGGNALTSSETIDRLRISEKNAPSYRYIVVAVDPPGSESGDEAGIVADAYGHDGDYYCIADESLQAKPEEWGTAAVDLFEWLDADVIVGEVNHGGDMVESTISTVDPTVPFEDVRAKKGKRLRAEDVSVLYNKKDAIHHVGRQPELEEQIVKWTPAENWSPDRLDAHVYALKKLRELFEGETESNSISRFYT